MKIDVVEAQYLFRNGRGLESASFALGEGGVCGLVGLNGSGKSTLFSLLSTHRRPQSGKVLVDGGVLSGRSLRSYRRRLGWVPQGLDVDRRRSVGDFLRYAAWLKEVPRGRRQASVDASLEMVALGGHQGDRLGDLSGGMRQRVMIAQALVHEPDVLLLDEPTAGLDPDQRVQLCALVKALGRDRIVLIATHILEDVSLCCDSVVMMSDGRSTGLQTLQSMLGDAEPTVEALRVAMIGESGLSA